MTKGESHHLRNPSWITNYLVMDPWKPQNLDPSLLVWAPPGVLLTRNTKLSHKLGNLFRFCRWDSVGNLDPSSEKNCCIRPSLLGTKPKTEMNNYSAINSFFWPSPPLYNKNKNNSDFIFVGPRLITYLQQKLISFLLPFLVNKNENNFEHSMT